MLSSQRLASRPRHIPGSRWLATLIVAGLLLLTTHASALSFRRNGGENHVFAEVGGSGLVASLNYEYRYGGALTFRVGFMPGLGDYLEQTYITVPVTMGFLAGTEAHMLDVSGGVTFTPTNMDTAQATVNVGYRYISVEGYVFRAFYTQLYELKKGIFYPWGGLSAGLSF